MVCGFCLFVVFFWEWALGVFNFRPCAQIVKVMSEMITIINDHDYYSTMIMIMRTNWKSDGWDDYVLNGA